MAVAFALVVSVVSLFVMLFALRWLILGRMPQGIAMLGREVESLRKRVERLETEVQSRERSPS